MTIASTSPLLFLKLHLPVNAMCDHAIGEILANSSIIACHRVASIYDKKIKMVKEKENENGCLPLNNNTIDFIYHIDAMHLLPNGFLRN